MVQEHIQHIKESSHKVGLEFAAPKQRSRGALKKGWKDVIRRDCAETDVTVEVAQGPYVYLAPAGRTSRALLQQKLPGGNGWPFLRCTSGNANFLTLQKMFRTQA